MKCHTDCCCYIVDQKQTKSTKIIKKQYNPEISKKYFKNQNKNNIENIIKNTTLSDEKIIELIKHLYLKIDKDSQNSIQDFIFNS